MLISIYCAVFCFTRLACIFCSMIFYYSMACYCFIWAFLSFFLFSSFFTFSTASLSIWTLSFSASRISTCSFLMAVWSSSMTFSFSISASESSLAESSVRRSAYSIRICLVTVLVVVSAWILNVWDYCFLAEDWVCFLITSSCLRAEFFSLSTLSC